MFPKSLLVPGIVLGTVVSSISIAHAATLGVMDSCQPHDWQRFSEAVASNDIAALQAMLAEPERRICDALVPTVVAIVCDQDPLSCVAPAGGPVWIVETVSNEFHGEHVEMPDNPYVGTHDEMPDNPFVGVHDEMNPYVGEQDEIGPFVGEHAEKPDNPYVGEHVEMEPFVGEHAEMPANPYVGVHVAMEPFVAEQAGNDFFFGPGGPFQGQRPGQSVGTEQDHADPASASPSAGGTGGGYTGMH